MNPTIIINNSWVVVVVVVVVFVGILGVQPFYPATDSSHQLRPTLSPSSYHRKYIATAKGIHGYLGFVIPVSSPLQAVSMTWKLQGQKRKTKDTI
jgi:hypothetical protein